MSGRAGDRRAPSGLRTEEGSRRPPRPVLVELAAAMLVVSGLLSTLTTIEAIMTLSERGTVSGPVALLSIALGVGTVILGILVRYARAWLVAVNVAAVAGFLELTSGAPVGYLAGTVDVVVVLLLFRERPWFHWTPDDEGEDEDEPG